MMPDSDRDAVRDAIRLADLHVAARQPIDVRQPKAPMPHPPTSGEGAYPVRLRAHAALLRPGTILVPREPRRPRLG